MMNERKTFDEWVKLYEKKMKQKFKRNKALKLFFFPERGFCEIGVLDDMVIAQKACGDGLFWRRVLEILAISLNMSHCGFCAGRGNVKAYMRLAGVTIESTEVLEDGHERYHVRDSEGQTGVLSPAGVSEDNGNLVYYVTWKVKGV